MTHVTTVTHFAPAVRRAKAQISCFWHLTYCTPRAKALQLPPMTVGPYNALVSGASGIQVLASSGAGLRRLFRVDPHTQDAACAQAIHWSDYVMASLRQTVLQATLLLMHMPGY